MKIALAQTHLTIGDIKQNFQNIQKQIEQAISAGAKLVVFPEQANTVKEANDLLNIPQYIASANEFLDKLIPFSYKISILIGVAEKIQNSFYNSAFLIQQGKTKQIATQNNIPYADLKWFTPNEKNEIFEIDGIKFLPILRKDPAKIDTDYIIRLNSEPFTKTKELSKTKNTITVSHTGLGNGHIFDGSSYVTNSNGNISALAEKYKEDLLIFDTDNLCELLPKPEAKEEAIFNALSYGFKEFCRINNFKKGLIGLSGGIDSALTAVIMCDALGAENILGITMPSKYSTEGPCKKFGNGMSYKTDKTAF